jgi:hypothetical protein
MIYDAANFAESVPDTIIARMQNLYPYTKDLLTAAFDRMLGKSELHEPSYTSWFFSKSYR